MSMDLQVGDILFLKGTGLIDRLIESYDGGKYSHCMMIVSVEPTIQIIEAQYNTRVRICDLYTSDYDVVSMNFTDEQKDKLLQIIPQFLGRGYDYKKILWFLCKKYLGLDLKFLNNDEYDEICSELLETILYMLAIIPSSEVGIHTPDTLSDYLITLNK